MAAAVYNRLHNSSMLGGGGHHSQLARSLERILEEAHHSGELILTNRKLKDFPKTATKYNLTDTVIADLSRNRFCELPEEITTFSFLETLLLYHNTIRSIPESVKHLTSLTYLDLRSNQLSSLPREVCFLPLQVLLVSNNRLTALPDELGRMDRLTDLDAAYNQLSALPARIGELRSLRSFSLRSNQLMYLPRELTCLTLVSLDVSNNRIASLPLEIRQMSTLVEFNLENNPLTSPPASLCVRGLVHVFKFLETQATKDEKGSRAGGNYDGYTTLRRAPRHNSNGNVLESNRVPRHHVDSGYSTCDGIDKRWSHDLPSIKPKSDSPIRKTPTTPTSSLSSTLMDASLTSSTSTIVDEPIVSSNCSPAAAVVKPLHTESFSADASPVKQKLQQLPPAPLPPATLHQHINYAHSSSSNGSSPDMEDAMIDHHQTNHHNNKADDKINKNLGNIQTYREYKEALKQQRNQEISSVYKIKGQKTLYDMSEASNALNSNSEESNEMRFVNGTTNNGGSPVNNTHSTTPMLPKSIMKNGTNGTTNGINGGGAIAGDECVVIPKKPIQKVIPSRNTELMASHTRLNSNDSASHASNGDSLGGYVKPNSPMKAVNGGILTNNNSTATTASNKFGTTGGIKSPVATSTKLATTKNRVTWNHDIPPEKLSFTMRREFDRQREETELMTQLRSIIETRLKMTLPEDIASALTDGVILCHLANYVRPRSVASIHVPSPGVSKLTMARCRRNVDNFLEACRKIGVDEELICSCADVVPPYDSDENNDDDDKNYDNLCYNNNNAISSEREQEQEQEQEQENEMKVRKCRKLPNPSAVLKTVSALIALDSNPHHQNIRNMQQQQELQRKLQQYQQQENHHLQHQYREYENEQQHYQSRYDVLDKEQQHQQQQQQQQSDDNEQEQLTATGTKKQQQHEIVTSMEFNSNINFNTKCHFENSLINGNGHDNSNHDDRDHDHDNNDVHPDDADNVVDAFTVASHAQQQHLGKMGNFLRHAKLKTFQKIKLNLISTHGTNNNHCSTLTTATTTTLQTIVETETDVHGGGSNTGATGSPEGVYHLINEKPKSTEVVNNKYKLLELPTLHVSSATTNTTQSTGNGDVKKMVSKRIEFFEHSVMSPTAGSGVAGESKPKPKNGIFSIYRVADIVADGKLQLQKDCVTAEKEAGSSLLKHDSHVLTIILSCVFIVTFLLLVFFPLPG